MKNWRQIKKKFNISVLLIRGYQYIFSPNHGLFSSVFGYNQCIFFPSCSEYALSAISQYGLMRGSMVSLKRIVRCHPYSKGGFDYLPKK